MRGLATSGRLVRVPPHVLSRNLKTLRAMDAFRIKHQREATLDEIALAVGLDPEKLVAERNGSKATGHISLDSRGFSPAGDARESLGAKLVAAGRPASKVDEEFLNRALFDLSPREQRIIIRRFGLDGDDPQTLGMIGKEMGITRERIRQIEKKALLYLRGCFLSRGKIKKSYEIHRRYVGPALPRSRIQSRSSGGAREKRLGQVPEEDKVSAFAVGRSHSVQGPPALGTEVQSHSRAAAISFSASER